MQAHRLVDYERVIRNIYAVLNTINRILQGHSLFSHIVAHNRIQQQIFQLIRLIFMEILIVPESMKVRARTSKVCLLPWEHFLLLTHSTSLCESALIEWRPGRICSLAQRRRQKSTLGKESIVTCPKVTLSPRAPD